MDCVVKKNIGIMAYICDLVTMLSFNFIVSFKLMLYFFFVPNPVTYIPIPQNKGK